MSYRNMCNFTKNHVLKPICYVAITIIVLNVVRCVGGDIINVPTTPDSPAAPGDSFRTAVMFSELILKEHGATSQTVTRSQFSDLLNVIRLANGKSQNSTVGSINGLSKSSGEEHNCTAVWNMTQDVGYTHLDQQRVTRVPTAHSIQCMAMKQCISADLLVELISNNGSSHSSDVTVNDLVDLCPLLLYQQYHGFCSDPPSQDEALRQPVNMEVWLYGFLFVTVISLCSLVGVSMLPLMGKKMYNRLLTFLIGLAVGSLSSSAVFHLIPQAFNLIPPGGGGNHEYLWVSLTLMGGIYMFFITERVMKIIVEAKKRTDKARCTEQDVLKQQSTATSLVSLGNNDPSHSHIIYNWTERGAKMSHKHEHEVTFKSGQDNAIATVAWMIIFGDGLHNFIDGLSIGAGFCQSVLTGISISVAVICEEFPHELGDFAVLLNSGMSMKQALLYNLLSATTCYLGLIAGILLGELSDNSSYIFALASGMFLYISLVDMVPELNAEAMLASKEGVYQAVKVLLIQSLGWLTGVVSLFLLAYYNEHFTFG